MYKLKNSYIDRMIAAQVSKKELAFLLYIARYQDASGTVNSVYYKNVCNNIECSIQKFYDILSSLAEKGLLKYEKVYASDIVVHLIDNDFSDNNFKCGYINVAKKDFQSDKFKNMLAGSQLLYLYTQRFIEGKHMLVSGFYEEFCKIFRVAHKTMQIYLQELKDNKLLFISKKRNKAYHFEMTMKRSSCLDVDDFLVPNEKDTYLDNIKSLLMTNFGGYFTSEDTAAEIAGFADTKRAAHYDNFISLIVQAVKSGINLQKREKKKSIALSASLVNKCLSEAIEMRLTGQFKYANT